MTQTVHSSIEIPRSLLRGFFIGDPAVQSLRPQSPFINTVADTPAHADNFVVLDADIERTAIRAKHARRLDPPVGFGFEVGVDSAGPLAVVGCPLAPDIRDAVAAFVSVR